MLLKTLVLIIAIASVHNQLGAAGIGGVLASTNEKFFRHDYIYNEDFAAYYKLHSADKSKAWDEAFVTCDDEGAKLFYPEGLDEWRVAANLTESAPNVEGIFVGVRDEFGLGDFVSTEGLLVPEFSRHSAILEGGEAKCVVMSVRTGFYNIGSCKNKRAFICKKVDNETCPTIDSAYIYLKATKKCYKINRRPKIWSHAHHTCLMEGGILATPTKEIVRTVLSNFMNNEELYFIGARRIHSNSSFYDTQGSMFEVGEERRNDENNCKVLTSNIQSDEYPKIRVHSYDCNKTLPFICEMQVKV